MARSRSHVSSYNKSAVQVSAADISRLSVSLSPDSGSPELIDIKGKCPRCLDDVHYRVFQQMWGLEAPSGGGGATIEAAGPEFIQRIRLADDALRRELAELLRRHSPSGSRDLTLQCNCAEQHDKLNSGCGAWFGLHLDWNPDDEGKLEVALSPGGPVTVYEENLAGQRDQLAQTTLERLRATAGHSWTGLLALIALIPTLAVVKGTNTLDDLSNHDKTTILVLTAVGAVFIIGAALFALRATYGPLRLLNVSSDDDPTALRQTEARKSSHYLQATMAAAVLGGLALLAAIIWALHAPASTPGKFAVTRTDDSVECGTLVGTTATAIKVKKSSGDIAVIPFTQVKVASFATKC